MSVEITEVEKPAVAGKPRESSVTIGIKRLLNTAQYESLEVNVATTDSVTWTTPVERSKKIDGLAKFLVAKFQETQKTVLAEIGCAEKAAWFKQPAKKPLAPSTLGDELLT